MTRSALRRKLWLAVAAVAGLSMAMAGVAVAAVGAPGATYNVKTYGAKGDGKANDAAAINKAITAANGGGGGIVQFPKGTYKVGATVHLKSNVTLQLDAGSTISATGSSGGHVAMILNGCNNIRSDHLTVRTANNRDGWNIISAQHVRITNVDIAASDDALGFKSDFALGKHFQNGDVVVDHAKLSSSCCNALMFGSETCGDFTGYHFTNIQITRAGKSGIGLTSQDGGKFADINYENVTLSGTAAPITLKVGTRKRCGDKPGVGDITNIHFKNIRGTNAGGAWSPTIWGQPGHPVKNVTFDNVKLTLPGGHGAMDPTKVPSDNGNYNPRGIGTRPAYGWYLHIVQGITFTNSSVDVAKADKRPGLIANSGSAIRLDGFTAEGGGGAPFDIGFQNITGYCVLNAGSAKISATGSSKSC